MPHAAPARPEARMDLVIRAPGIPGQINVDLTVVNASSREALLKGAAARDGTATRVAANHKRRHYPNIVVVPFVLEEHGRIGEEALALARRLAPSEPRARSGAMRKLYQALSATLQRHQADSTTAAMARAPAASAVTVIAASAGGPQHIAPPAAADVRLRSVAPMSIDALG